MNCDFERIETGQWQCRACGYVTKKANYETAPAHPCGVPRPESPSLASKAYSITAAMAKWIAAGRPRRTPEQIAEVFAICQGCPEFRSRDAANGTCNLCGCPLRQKGGVIDKISMATEGCPAGRWLPTA